MGPTPPAMGISISTHTHALKESRGATENPGASQKRPEGRCLRNKEPAEDCRRGALESGVRTELPVSLAGPLLPDSPTALRGAPAFWLIGPKVWRQKKTKGESLGTVEARGEGSVVAAMSCFWNHGGSMVWGEFIELSVPRVFQFAE